LSHAAAVGLATGVPAAGGAVPTPPAPPGRTNPIADAWTAPPHGDRAALCIVEPDKTASSKSLSIATSGRERSGSAPIVAMPDGGQTGAAAAGLLWPCGFPEDRRCSAGLANCALTAWYTGGATLTAVQVKPTDEAPVSALPEPRSWFLMLAGFAAIGAVLRPRARRAATATNLGETL
jgi:hypothetical protein